MSSGAAGGGGDVLAGKPPGGTGDNADNAHSWENVGSAAWESVAEDADGNLISRSSRSSSLADIVRRRRRLRARSDAAGGRRVVRDMIRYVYLLIDMSSIMSEKDPALPPGTRWESTIGVATEFVARYYDENPISHLGLVIAKDGEAELLTQLGGNPKVHVQALARANAAGQPCGEFSLQNGLEVAGRSLGHMPGYGSREIVVLCGALSTCDPGDLIVETLPRLRKAEIRVSCIALSAEIYVCRRIAEETNGTMNVCLDKNHFKDLFLAQCTPPPASISSPADDNDDEEIMDGNNKRRKKKKYTCEFIPMGFPIRETSAVPSLIHATKDKKLFARTGYLCPRCKAKVYELPTDCAVCGLKLVLSPHLARSFHHLFPVPPFVELPMGETLPDGPPSSSSSGAAGGTSSSSPRRRGGQFGPNDVDSSLLTSSKDKDGDKTCYACLKYIGPMSADTQDGGGATSGGNKKSTSKKGKNRGGAGRNTASSSDDATLNLRFQCPDCTNIFCPDCDAYLHETLHNCPGCLSKG